MLGFPYPQLIQRLVAVAFQNGLYPFVRRERATLMDEFFFLTLLDPLYCRRKLSLCVGLSQIIVPALSFKILLLELCMWCVLFVDGCVAWE